jgi:Mal s 1 allergenic protein-like
MRTKARRQVSISLVTLVCLSAFVAFSRVGSTEHSSKVKTQSPETTKSTPLPGKGLAQHPFLYAGEWDTRKPDQTIFLIRGGRVVWTYAIPIKNEKGALNEFDDIHLLSNGNVLFARKTGASEVTAEKKVIWNYDAPEGTEIHSAQPIGPDRVLFMQNGTPAKLILMNKKTSKVEMEHVVATARPDDPKSVHGQFRHVRMTRAGTYLVSHLNMGKVVEYDKNWKEIWSYAAPSAWAAVRLKNGNTLISGNQHGYVREVNPKGEVVWEINKDDLPGFPLYVVQEVDRLANGNTVICNWSGFLKKSEWPNVIQIIEVTPQKKVVWALREWSDPDLGPASCIQLLDERGKEENGDLQR